MDAKWCRAIDTRLSKLERFEKARYHRRMVIVERAWFTLIFAGGLVLAAGLGSLMN